MTPLELSDEYELKNTMKKTMKYYIYPQERFTLTITKNK